MSVKDFALMVNTVRKKRKDEHKGARERMREVAARLKLAKSRQINSYHRSGALRSQGWYNREQKSDIIPVTIDKQRKILWT